MNRSRIAILSLVVLASATVAQAHSIPPTNLDGPARLVTTGNESARWMTPLEMAKLSYAAHASGRCGGFMDITDHADVKPTFEPALFLIDRPHPTHEREVEALISQLVSSNLAQTITKLSSYHNRYYQNESAVQAAQWIAQTFADLGAKRSDVKVALYPHKFKMPSVIARIEGQGPLASEVVVLGAHADSINQNVFFPNPTGRAPGADDDASGVSTLIETFRVIAESGFRPARTIEFIAYAGEEAGLLGSQDIANSYRQQGKRVVAVLQLDMTMFPGQSREIAMIMDNVNVDLSNFVKRLIDTYVRVPWREDKCGYACSDHASWHKAGFPAAFPFESMAKQMNPDIHKPTDTIDKLDIDFGLHFAKLATAFAVELSSER